MPLVKWLNGGPTIEIRIVPGLSEPGFAPNTLRRYTFEGILTCKKPKVHLAEKEEEGPLAA